MFRWLFNRSGSVVSEEQALVIAKTECISRDWPWLEPVYIQMTRHGWLIRTNKGKRGANAIFIVDRNTGSIIDTGFMPR
jgi:hypothetical protein